MTIGVQAEVAGVSIETIRCYQRKRMLREPDRPVGGSAVTGRHLTRVCFIKSAQRLGFSLDEMADLLKLEYGSHCTEARAQAERILAAVRTRLADLHPIEGVLQDLVRRWCAADGDVRCPMIQALQEA